MVENNTDHIALQSEDIPCALLPMVGSTLLLPKVTIAEMALVSPVEDIDGTPIWFEGYFYWRDQKVPIISYERLNGKSRYPLNPLGRVAVLHTYSGDENLPFVAFSTQGIPKDITINEGNISQAGTASLSYCENLLATVGLNAYVVPDLTFIEQEIQKVLEGIKSISNK